MSYVATQELPSTARLIKATALSMAVAAVVLVTTVLPAEYGIDPTGIGRLLGLDALQPASEPDAPQPAAVPVDAPAQTSAANAALAAKAEAAFGKAEGQTLDAAAVSLSGAPLRRDTLTLTLPPGKGAEIKAHLKQGDGLSFHWTATGDVAVDMHGERPEVKKAWTSYAVETAQRAASGTFVAPFNGTHGWYWQNRGTEAVEVRVEVVGFQSDLYRP